MKLFYKILLFAIVVTCNFYGLSLVDRATIIFTSVFVYYRNVEIQTLCSFFAVFETYHFNGVISCLGFQPVDIFLRTVGSTDNSVGIEVEVACAAAATCFATAEEYLVAAGVDNVKVEVGF